MSFARLFIPGEFDDAQLYMGHLITFGSDRSISICELEELTQSIEENDAQWRGIATPVFARNEWLSSNVFESLMRQKSVAKAWRNELNRLSDEVLEVRPDELRPIDDLRVPSDRVLDSHLYGNRLYVGTNEGFFHSELELFRGYSSPFSKRSDARCISTSASYGAVNASCESDGLLTGFDEFGWSGGKRNTDELVVTAPESIRSSWLGTDVVNYGRDSIGQVFRGDVDKVEPPNSDAGRESKKKLVTMLSPSGEDLDPIFQRVEKSIGPEGAQDIQYVWNSSRAFFVNTYSKGFFTATWDREKDHVTLNKQWGESKDRVIDVHKFSSGWVVETDFGVFRFKDGELEPLLGQEPISVRTYMGSKRYKKLITVCVEDGLHVISVLD